MFNRLKLVQISQIHVVSVSNVTIISICFQEYRCCDPPQHLYKMTTIPAQQIPKSVESPALQRKCLLFPKQMAGHLMARPDLNQFRLFFHAAVHTVGATVVERAARGQIQRAGGFALDTFDFLRKVHLRIKNRSQ